MVCPFDETLHSKQKEWIIETSYKMSESQNNYAEWKMPEKKMISFIWNPRKDKLI